MKKMPFFSELKIDSPSIIIMKYLLRNGRVSTPSISSDTGLDILQVHSILNSLEKRFLRSEITIVTYVSSHHKRPQKIKYWEIDPAKLEKAMEYVNKVEEREWQQEQNGFY